MTIEVRTQAEFDAAWRYHHADPDALIVIMDGRVHVEAWDSAHVEAAGAVQVRALGSAVVVALTASVVVSVHGDDARVEGPAVIVKIVPPTTAAEWCAYQGRTVAGGAARLFKAVRDDYTGKHGLRYEPGSTVEAPDWDGGKAECGGGLHFSPAPALAATFDDKATRFVECLVAVADMRVPQPGDRYPDKIKARACRVVGEVGRDGRPVAP